MHFGSTRPSGPAFRGWPAGLVALAVSLAAAVAAFPAPSADTEAAPAPAAPASFAVVELFTSQGCNSCPRADQALAALVHETHGQLPVYSIEWHVDYWDYLGWPDPYALPEAAPRQRRYSRMLNSRTYTPQMVVNGRIIVRPAQDAALVRSTALNLLEPERPGDVSLTVAVRVRRPGSVEVDCSVAGAPSNAILTLVVVERGLENYVPRGENAGRTLQHANVARGFATVDLGEMADGSRSVPVTIPPEVETGRSSVIAYLQDRATLRIVGAAMAPL